MYEHRRMYERDAKKRVEILGREIAIAGGGRRNIRVGNDGSRIIAGSSGVDAIIELLPDDRSAVPEHYMIRVRFVVHGSDTEVGEPFNVKVTTGASVASSSSTCQRVRVAFR